MRPTLTAHSDMPTGKGYIGWWGDMGGPKQKGVVQYGVSPFQQRPFAGALHGYLFNGFRRIMHFVPYFGPPAAIGYGVYVWGKNKSAYYNSKQGHHDLAEAEGGHH